MRSRILAIPALLALASSPVAAQVTLQPAMLSRASVPAAAAAHFEAGMVDADYVFFPRAASHFRLAVEAAPAWGVARVLSAQFAPNLTREQRIAEMNRGVADAAAGSTQELLAAMVYRERFVSGLVAARPLTHALAELAPGDPRFATLDALRGGLTPATRITAMRGVLEKFPASVGAYNLIAYDSWNSGDQAGALQAAEAQVRLAGDQANPHDTYAEILQWAGRLDEARTHYQHTADRAADFFSAYVGIADVDHLQGNGARARDGLNGALPKATLPADAEYLRLAVATSYLVDGELGPAQRILAEVLPTSTDAAEVHLRMALADAALGRGRDVAGHLAAMGEVDDGAAAIIYGLAGQAAPARAAADRFALRAAGGVNPVVQQNARVAGGFAMIAEGNCAAAAEVFRAVQPMDAVAATGLAICLERTGSRAEARRVAAEGRADRQLALDDFFGASLRGRLLRIR